MGADVARQLVQLFWTARAAQAYLPDGGSIINTSSINGLRGNKSLIDYAASKGAVLTFTYSLAQALQDRGIRVNCVASGPVWTPLTPATFEPEKVSRFGSQVPMGRAAHPDEIARSYVFLPPGACPALTPASCSHRSAGRRLFPANRG